MPIAKTTNRSVDVIEEEVAAKVRALRIERSMSQTELGVAIGVSFQQIQKYERARNRMSVGTFLRICHALGASHAEVLDDIEIVQSREKARMRR